LLKRHVGKALQTNGAKTFIQTIICLNDKKKKTLLMNGESTFLQVSLAQMVIGKYIADKRCRNVYSKHHMIE
jgi:hypothetical protein